MHVLCKAVLGFGSFDRMQMLCVVRGRALKGVSSLHAHTPQHAHTPSQINASIAALLPPGTQIFANAASDYHCTLYHLSHLYDPRPVTDSAAAAAAVATLEPHERPQVGSITFSFAGLVAVGVLAAAGRRLCGGGGLPQHGTAVLNSKQDAFV